jgi:hypothetical protein
VAVGLPPAQIRQGDGDHPDAYDKVKIKDVTAMAVYAMAVYMDAVVRCHGPEPCFTPEPVRALVVRVLGSGGTKKPERADEVVKLAVPENLKSVS